MAEKTGRLNVTNTIMATGWIGLIFLVLPVIVVIPMSFVSDRYLKFPPAEWSLAWYHNLFTNAQWYVPLIRSISVAFLVACVSVLLGMMGAYSLHHNHWRLKPAILFLVLLPLFIPPVIIGVGLLLLFAKISLADTVIGVVLSHILLTMPYSILLFSVAISRANMKLEDVACGLGASRFFAFCKVSLPQLWNGLLAAWVLSFIVSFDEPVIALFLTSSNARTLPRQMFDGIRYDLDPTAAAISTLLIIISICVAVIHLRKGVSPH